MAGFEGFAFYMPACLISLAYLFFGDGALSRAVAMREMDSSAGLLAFLVGLVGRNESELQLSVASHTVRLKKFIYTPNTDVCFCTTRDAFVPGFMKGR